MIDRSRTQLARLGYWRRVAGVVLAVAIIVGGGVRAADDIPSVLISRQLSQRDRIGIGDVIRLSLFSDGRRAQPFRVAGVYEPTPDPSRLGAVVREVRLHLPDLLDVTRLPDSPAGTEYVETINVALVDPGDAERFARDVAASTPGLAAHPTGEGDNETAAFVVLQRFHMAIAAVTILASTVFLLALTVMLVNERRGSVGVLRLIGLPVRRILVQLFIEGVLIATLGSLFGLALALASEEIINRFFQWRYDTTLVFVRVTPSVASVSLAIAIPLGVAATLGAAWALLRRSGLRLARR